MKDFELFGRKLIDVPDTGDLLFLFGIDFIFLFLIIRFIYLRMSNNREYIFTFFIFNIVIFFLCAMLSSVKLKVGFAFGLFAILSILRYRTETVPIKEMTFLFISITLAVINSLVSKKVSITEILITNVVIVTSTYLVERLWLKGSTYSQKIKYEKIELIHTDKREELLADLNQRLGKEIKDIEITYVDFLTDTATIKVFYDAPHPT
ncbi:MAG: DUF4956 domain-containing protein [Bacteroidia bacterium]|nr:DUF4956 domain-containing protein [Bacteroidia bacterium]